MSKGSPKHTPFSHWFTVTNNRSTVNFLDVNLQMKNSCVSPALTALLPTLNSNHKLTVTLYIHSSLEWASSPHRLFHNSKLFLLNSFTCDRWLSRSPLVVSICCGWDGLHVFVLVVFVIFFGFCAAEQEPAVNQFLSRAPLIIALTFNLFCLINEIQLNP